MLRNQIIQSTLCLQALAACAPLTSIQNVKTEQSLAPAPCQVISAELAQLKERRAKLELFHQEEKSEAPETLQVMLERAGGKAAESSRTGDQLQSNANEIRKYETAATEKGCPK